MTSIRLKSSKIAPLIPMDQIVNFFRMKRASSWKEYIRIDGSRLEDILKRSAGGMEAYLFEFGCVTFVDFEEDDITVFLDFLSGLVEGIDFASVARFSETHTVTVEDPEAFRPWPESPVEYRFEDTCVEMMAVILAKSAAMNKIELDVGLSIDESEKYIDYLRRGKLRMNKKAIMSVVNRFLKLEFESIRSIRIFDRSAAADISLNSRRLHDAFAEYMELYDRFDGLQSKLGSLRSTMKAYNSLSYRQSENRLYWFEIFLLGLFPVVELVRLFL